MTPIVVSDLEGTLTTGETWRGVGRYLATHGRAPAFRAFLVTHTPGVLLARARLIDMQTFRNRWVTELVALLRGASGLELDRMAEWVVEQELWPKRRAGVLAELACHHAAAGRVVLASGTYQPVLDRFAARLGVEAIGTPLAMNGIGEGARFSGRLAGPVNTGLAKLERLRAALGGVAPDVAYGDTLADLPMLELSQAAVAVHPDAELRKAAVARGWRVLLTEG